MTILASPQPHDANTRKKKFTVALQNWHVLTAPDGQFHTVRLVDGLAQAEEYGADVSLASASNEARRMRRSSSSVSRGEVSRVGSLPTRICSMRSVVTGPGLTPLMAAEWVATGGGGAFASSEVQVPPVSSASIWGLKTQQVRVQPKFWICAGNWRG